MVLLPFSKTGLLYICYLYELLLFGNQKYPTTYAVQYKIVVVMVRLQVLFLITFRCNKIINLHVHNITLFRTLIETSQK